MQRQHDHPCIVNVGFLLRVVIILATVNFAIANQQQQYQGEQTCTAQGTCEQANYYSRNNNDSNNNNNNNNSHNNGNFVVERIPVEFGEPQVIMNHDGEITRQKILETRQYMAAYYQQIKYNDKNNNNNNNNNIKKHDDPTTSCWDSHYLCAFWAAIGECQKNHSWMISNCGPSCQACIITPTTTTTETASSTTTIATTTKTAETVHTSSNDNNNNNNDNHNYKTSNLLQGGNNDNSHHNHIVVTIPYGNAQTVPMINADPVVQVIATMHAYMEQIVNLQDKYASVRGTCACLHSNCAIWAAKGECQRNPIYMNTTCAPVCATCEQLTYQYRCPIDENAPTVLPNPGDLNRLFEQIWKVSSSSQSYQPSLLSRPEGNINIYNNNYNNNRDDDSAVPKNKIQQQQHDNNNAPWVLQLDNFVSEEECKRLIELGGIQGYEDSMTFSGIHANNTSKHVIEKRVRTSTQTWCDKAHQCGHDPYVVALLGRIENLLRIPQNHYEDIQLLRYEESQFYRQHHDYNPYHKDQPQGVRILTLLIYLNDVTAGGETRFPYLDITVKPKRGRAVLWPNTLSELPNIQDFRTEHESLTVTKGVKYAANLWIHQRDYQSSRERNCV